MQHRTRKSHRLARLVKLVVVLDILEEEGVTFPKNKRGRRDRAASPQCRTVLSAIYCSGLSEAVAAALGLKRITPLWSAKK
jgi:hypothetical protein